MNGYEWDRHEIYADASGKLRACILSWSGGEVHMERWSPKNPRRRVRFSLPEKFFAESKSCGWRRIQ